MKMTFRQNLIIIISLCFVAGLVFYGPRPRTALTAPTFRTETIKEESGQKEGTTTAPYIISADYPVAILAAGEETDPNRAAAIAGLNTSFKSFVTDASESFKADAETIVLYPDEPDFKSELGIKYEIVTATPTFVSARFSIFSYSAGAAHPISFTSTLAYDLSANRTLALHDFFIKNSDYLHVISDYAIADLKEQFKDDAEALTDSIPEGAGPKQENFTAFVVEPKGLTVIFGPYQVGPYVIGTPEVLVPYEVLQQVIDPHIWPTQ